MIIVKLAGGCGPIELNPDGILDSVTDRARHKLFVERKPIGYCHRPSGGHPNRGSLIYPPGCPNANDGRPHCQHVLIPVDDERLVADEAAGAPAPAQAWR